MTDGYDAFARRIVASGLLSDPWLDGAPRFRAEPVIVSEGLARELYRASEEVAAVYNEMALIVADEPRFLDDFFMMTPFQKAMWMASQPHWHGIARADVFVTDEGLAFTEINCDTPTGEAEAVVLGALASEAPPRPGLVDPNRDLEARFVDMVDTLIARDLEPAATLAAAPEVEPDRRHAERERVLGVLEPSDSADLDRRAHATPIVTDQSSLSSSLTFWITCGAWIG